MFSNGNSFSEGNSFGTRDIREPWIYRLWRSVQDRGSV